MCLKKVKKKSKRGGNKKSEKDKTRLNCVIQQEIKGKAKKSPKKERIEENNKFVKLEKLVALQRRVVAAT